ncbi:MAG: hypothetical protein L3J46_03860 [Kangiellaceae bacterium]|nr:hypothetical protein [Kangiellaceae bacterium]
MIFRNAIVKKPCRAMAQGITTANLGTPIYGKALQQHADYVNALKECGLKVTCLEADLDEAYAANSVWINDTVLTPKGFPKTKKMIEESGYTVREVDVSEFQKMDGGLSCLSLRF